MFYFEIKTVLQLTRYNIIKDYNARCDFFHSNVQRVKWCFNVILARNICEQEIYSRTKRKRNKKIIFDVMFRDKQVFLLVIILAHVRESNLNVLNT